MPALFDYINSILKKEVYYSKDEDLKGYSPYMVNRFFMSEKSYVSLIAEMNGEYSFSPRMHYDMLYHAIPKSKNFLKYNMRKEEKEQHLQYLMKYFNVDIQRAKTYNTLITDEERSYIIEYYSNRGVSEKIKKNKK